MAWFDVVTGYQTWSDYVSSHDQIRGFDQSLNQQSKDIRQELRQQGKKLQEAVSKGAFQLGLKQKEYQVALESGLGALGNNLNSGFEVLNANVSHGFGELASTVEFGFERLAEGIDKLNADFNLLMGDVIWKLEMQQQSLNHILQEIRLADFEREARTYRNNAEEAYQNGWYDDALADFLEAEKRNRRDFAVHRSIGNIYFYHLIDLDKAVDYFSKAAKYARPYNARHSAESHYFAGMVSATQQKLQEARAHLSEAISLNTRFYEAHYMLAGFAAMLGDALLATQSLEKAINGDPRYFERSKSDRMFDSVRPQITPSLDRILRQAQENVVKAEREVGYWLDTSIIIIPGSQKRITELYNRAKEQIPHAKLYRDWVELKASLDSLNGIVPYIYKHEFPGHRERLNCLAFSPDGHILVSASIDKTIKIWDVPTGKIVQTLQADPYDVRSVAFSPDGSFLASAGHEQVKVWDTRAWRELFTLAPSSSVLMFVAFSFDGRLLASGSMDSSISIWEIPSKNLIQTFYSAGKTLSSLGNILSALTFSPTSYLLAAAEGKGIVHLWDLNTGKEKRIATGDDQLASVAFSPDGLLMATCSIESIKLWDINSGDELLTIDGVYSNVCFSPDGRFIASASPLGGVRLCDVATGKEVHSLKKEFEYVGLVEFSSNGQFCAAGDHTPSLDHEYSIKVWLKGVMSKQLYANQMAKEKAARDRIEQGRIAKEYAQQDAGKEQRRAAGECEICAVKLGFLEKAAGKVRCKAHR